MTAGRGFIALATPYLGGGHPIGTGLASMIFGFFYALSIRTGTLQIPNQLPDMLPYLATVMALVIYALQNQLTARVRTLRSAEGEKFDATFWRAIQRLSVLHMFLAMLAVFGIVISLSMFSAPDGFQGPSRAFPRGAAIGVISLALIGINLPFMLDVERIGRRSQLSAGVSALSLWLYLGLLFMLYLKTTSLTGAALPLGFVVGLALGIAVWLVLGGQYLWQYHRRQLAAAA